MKVLSYPTKAAAEAALVLVDEALRLIYLLGSYELDPDTGEIHYEPGKTGMANWAELLDLGGGKWGFQDPRPRFNAAAARLLGDRQLLPADLNLKIARKSLSTQLKAAIQGTAGTVADRVPAVLDTILGQGQLVDWVEAV